MYQILLQVYGSGQWQNNNKVHDTITPLTCQCANLVKFVESIEHNIYLF